MNAKAHSDLAIAKARLQPGRRPSAVLPDPADPRLQPQTQLGLEALRALACDAAASMRTVIEAAMQVEGRTRQAPHPSGLDGWSATDPKS
jgi:hypothetical protein